MFTPEDGAPCRVCGTVHMAEAYDVCLMAQVESEGVVHEPESDLQVVETDRS